MRFIRQHIDILLILLVGFVLRLSVATTHSYTNDELSAINRLRYSSFSDLIEYGVMKGDMHPAGVQVFEKLWSSLFGTSEFALRLPFVLSGVISVFLIFLIGWKWFNRRTGIIAAVVISTLYFPVIQSELARPYSPGLMIALSIAWFYHKVLFCEVKRYAYAILLGLSFAAAMYTHYYLFLFALFIGFTGLFFLKRDNFKLYFLAAGIAVLLFLPHLQVTLFHLNVGGLGWLGKPEPGFLFQFIYNAFNSSWILIGIILISLVASLFVFTSSELFKTRSYLLCATWFFGMFIVGFIVSHIGTPVLKEPVMLFSFPFLILMISYLLSRIPPGYFFAPLLFLGISLSTLFEKGLYDIRHHGYRETARHMVAWNKQYGDENIYTMYNLSNPDYLNFYAKRLGDSIQFERNLIEFGDTRDVFLELAQSTSPFCVVGYAERPTTPQIFEIANYFYPNVVEYYNYDNSTVFLLSREDAGEKNPGSELLSAMDLYDLSGKSWTIDTTMIAQGSDNFPNHYVLQNERQYGPDFNFTLADLADKKDFYFRVCVRAIASPQSELTATLTATRDGVPLYHNEDIFWMGQDLEYMLYNDLDSTTSDQKAFFAFEIPPFIEETDELKISLWNRNGIWIGITAFEIWLVEDFWRTN